MHVSSGDAAGKRVAASPLACEGPWPLGNTSNLGRENNSTGGRHPLRSRASAERRRRPWPSASGARSVCRLSQSGLYENDPSEKKKEEEDDTISELQKYKINQMVAVGFFCMSMSSVASAAKLTLTREMTLYFTPREWKQNSSALL